ncbi:hypothetical protein ACFWVC_37795 [Streptomyces sp. NPDC058691]|uniref:hypothetical protein n=1 Tax=Streptomyces sp. NPDC058691 TaxID=3346601 RepID=UPI00366A507E
MLRNAVESAARAQGQAHTGGSAHHQVHFDGGVDNRRGVIAADNVDLRASVTPTAAHPRPSADTPAAPSADIIATAPPDVTWKLLPTSEDGASEYYGFAVPFSASAGPTRVSGGTAAGYAHTPTGALIAGAQLSARSGPSSERPSWEPTITRQFVPSPDRDRHLACLRGQAVLPEPVQKGTLAQVGGFVCHSYTPDTAVIGLVLRSPTAQLGLIVLALKCRGNDWQMVAPPGGMWTSVKRTLGGTTGVVREGRRADVAAVRTGRVRS